MLAGGNLAVTSSTGRPLWTNAKDGHPGSYLVLGADGNLIQCQPVAGGRVQLWATNTAATHPDRTAAGCPAGAHHGLCARSVAAARSNTAARAIKFALAQVGKPYQTAHRFGPNGYDCSGLVWQAYRNAGTDIGANVASTIVTAGGPRRPIPMAEVRPGDIIWYRGHVAIALSGGNMVEAARPGTNVRVVGTAGRGFTRGVAINAN